MWPDIVTSLLASTKTQVATKSCGTRVKQNGTSGRSGGTSARPVTHPGHCYSARHGRVIRPARRGALGTALPTADVSPGHAARGVQSSDSRCLRTGREQHALDASSCAPLLGRRLGGMLTHGSAAEPAEEVGAARTAAVTRCTAWLARRGRSVIPTRESSRPGLAAQDRLENFRRSPVPPGLPAPQRLRAPGSPGAAVQPCTGGNPQCTAL